MSPNIHGAVGSCRYNPVAPSGRSSRSRQAGAQGQRCSARRREVEPSNGGRGACPLASARYRASDPAPQAMGCAPVAECGACGLPVQRACVRELACASLRLREPAPARRACLRSDPECGACGLPVQRACVRELACAATLPALRDELANASLPARAGAALRACLCKPARAHARTRCELSLRNEFQLA